MLPCNILGELQPPSYPEYTIEMLSQVEPEWRGGHVIANTAFDAAFCSLHEPPSHFCHPIVYSRLVGGWSSPNMLLCNISGERQSPF